jgi:hypothetical protein
LTFALKRRFCTAEKHALSWPTFGSVEAELRVFGIIACEQRRQLSYNRHGVAEVVRE